MSARGAVTPPAMVVTNAARAAANTARAAEASADCPRRGCCGCRVCWTAYHAVDVLAPLRSRDGGSPDPANAAASGSAAAGQVPAAASLSSRTPSLESANRQLDLKLSEWLRNPTVPENDDADVRTCLKVLAAKGITTTRRLLLGDLEDTQIGAGHSLPEWSLVKAHCEALFLNLGPDGKDAAVWENAQRESRRQQRWQRPHPTDGAAAAGATPAVAHAATGAVTPAAAHAAAGTTPTAAHAAACATPAAAAAAALATAGVAPAAAAATGVLGAAAVSEATDAGADMSEGVGWSYIAEMGTRNRLIAAIKEFFGVSPLATWVHSMLPSHASATGPKGSNVMVNLGAAGAAGTRVIPLLVADEVVLTA
jgi:hypothetical protein